MFAYLLAMQGYSALLCTTVVSMFFCLGESDCCTDFSQEDGTKVLAGGGKSGVCD